MPAYTLKLLIIGNERVGKTRFCNSFTNTQSKSSYQPTMPCRIIEYDTTINGISIDNKHCEQFDVTLEFWDISGDLKYKQCWNAMKKDCHGVIICYGNDDHSNMEISDIRMFYDHFMNKSMRSKQCLILSMSDEIPSLHKGTHILY